MPRAMSSRRWMLFSVLAGSATWAGACGSPSTTARIAVASNFREPAEELGSAFRSASSRSVTFIFGSTGHLYAQIVNGAPFDAFLAADQARAEKAVLDGLAVPGSRFTYVTGRLVLYANDASVRLGAETLRRGRFATLAIAEPASAPFGSAALEVLRSLSVLGTVRSRLVRGQNVTQALQFVRTGNADLGLVALSQVHRHGGGARWIIPDSLHSSIRQDAVLLERGAGNVTARLFLEFLRTPTAGAILRSFGYATA